MIRSPGLKKCTILSSSVTCAHRTFMCALERARLAPPLSRRGPCHVISAGHRLRAVAPTFLSRLRGHPASSAYGFTGRGQVEAERAVRTPVGRGTTLAQQPRINDGTNPLFWGRV